MVKIAKNVITNNINQINIMSEQKNNYILFFEHDLYNEACTLQDTPKGTRVKEQGKLSDLL